MIVLLTDYGYQGPYVGQLNAKIFEHSPDVSVIDLMHDLPAFNIQAAASLIPAITKEFVNNTIFICVVDPGVGSTRKPVLIKTDSHYYIGPDNGIFSKLNTISKSVQQWEITWRPRNLSTSFHGRDLFVPIACQLYNKTLNFSESLKEFPLDSNLNKNNQEVIYFDGFGNAITSIPSNTVDRNTQIRIKDYTILYGSYFSECEVGEIFWYKNSMELVEIACNQDSVKDKLSLSIGDVVELSN